MCRTHANAPVPHTQMEHMLRHIIPNSTAPKGGGARNGAASPTKSGARAWGQGPQQQQQNRPQRGPQPRDRLIVVVYANGCGPARAARIAGLLNKASATINKNYPHRLYRLYIVRQCLCLCMLLMTCIVLL